MVLKLGDLGQGDNPFPEKEPEKPLTALPATERTQQHQWQDEHLKHALSPRAKDLQAPAVWAPPRTQG
jgi:hypothetical protein